MRLKSIFFLTGYSLLLAFGHVLQKVVLNYKIDHIIFAFLRITFAFFLVLPLLLFNKKSFLKTVKKNYKHYLVLGIGFSGIGILLKFWGLSYTTAINASFIMSLSALVSIFFAFLFLKERISLSFYFLAFLTIVGVYLITTGGLRLVPHKGDLIILSVALIIGLMQVYGKNVLYTLSAIETSLGRLFIGMIFLGSLIPIFSKTNLQFLFNMKIMILIFLNGLTLGGSIFFFYKALQREGASNSGMFALLTPVFTAFLGFFILKETMNLLQLVGGFIILICLSFISKTRVKYK